jgi:hypothetical protein
MISDRQLKKCSEELDLKPGDSSNNMSSLKMWCLRCTGQGVERPELTDGNALVFCKDIKILETIIRDV